MVIWYSVMDKLIPQIEETLLRSVCAGWDRAFLESINTQIGKGKLLTAKQKATLGRVLSQNTEKDEKHMDGWKEEYFHAHQRPTTTFNILITVVKPKIYLKGEYPGGNTFSK